jgi:hypothetical protein
MHNIGVDASNEVTTCFQKVTGGVAALRLPTRPARDDPMTDPVNLHTMVTPSGNNCADVQFHVSRLD